MKTTIFALAIALALFALLAPQSLLADNVVTFDVSGTFTLTGTILIDTTLGTVVSENVVVENPGLPNGPFTLLFGAQGQLDYLIRGVVTLLVTY